jgi:hypothetical protein
MWMIGNGTMYRYLMLLIFCFEKTSTVKLLFMPIYYIGMVIEIKI